jgi:hypothetical protein
MKLRLFSWLLLFVGLVAVSTPCSFAQSKPDQLEHVVPAGTNALSQVLEVEQLPEVIATEVQERQAQPAQSDPVPTLNPDTIFKDWFDPLFSVLFLLLTYLSHLMPGLDRFKEPISRAIAVTLILVPGFLLFGAGFAKIALSWFISSGAYAWFLKGLFKTPKLE